MRISDWSSDVCSSDLPALVAGVITSTVSIVFSVSYAALVFSGRLAEYLPAGIGLALFSATVLGAVIALTSSCPGIVGAPQGVPAVPLALMTATEIGRAHV